MRFTLFEFRRIHLDGDGLRLWFVFFFKAFSEVKMALDEDENARKNWFVFLFKAFELKMALMED